MQVTMSLVDRINARAPDMSPAEQRVAGFFRNNREQVLIASASALAEQAGVSDATVIRATKALGFRGMDELRRTLAAELTDDLSPVGRLARTLREVGDGLDGAFHLTLDVQQKALESVRQGVSPEQFRSAVAHIIEAPRLAIFGIGPTGAMADYFAFQLRRFGIDSVTLTDTGALLADDIQRLRESDLLVAFAYSRLYRELQVLLDYADRRGVSKILVTDTLGGKLSQRVDVVLNVPRGRAEMVSMHTATLGLIETLLVGVATMRSDETLSNLRQLNDLRAELVGKSEGCRSSRKKM